MLKKIIVLLILIIVITGLAVNYFLNLDSLEDEGSLEDEISEMLKELKQEIAIEADVQSTELKWIVNVDPEIKDVSIEAKGFEVKRISEEQYTKIKSFLENKGFERDPYNMLDGTFVGLTGYRKDQLVCTVSGGTTGYKEAEGQWIPSEPDKYDITIKCGKLEKTIMEYQTAHWNNYENEKYGYSFKYPKPCLYGGLPGYCKQSPLEERPRECFCYFNAEDPNSVSLGTYTGTKSDLTGAAFVVFHSIYVDHYSPPAGTDLVNWVKENYAYYEDIPDEINMEIDGIPALKVYTPKSPMAWSQEDIYFIRNDKVFKISMLDVDNKDNKELYTKMLFTFRFIEILEKETIEVIMGDNFPISLEANPTTGYEWEVEFDSDYLELVNKEYIADSDESLVGAGGHRIFNFLALKSGNTSIKFSYLRSWEGNAIKTQVYEITITE